MNFYTPDSFCTVKYQDLDQAILYCIDILNRSGNSKEQFLYYGKTDLKSAFCLVPVKICQIHWLLIRAQNPNDGKFYFFADKNLPFGASISCKLFQDFSDSLRHIVENWLGTRFQTISYLDDFLFISTEETFCNIMVRTFILLCKKINCPLATDKTEWATTSITFLGILLDGQRHLLAVPEPKLVKARNLIGTMSER